MNGTTFEQFGQGLMTYPTKDWQKKLLKAPIALWRLGLGELAGKVFVLITHTGRKSGLPRRTLTEYHVIDGKKYVPCAYGEQSQWCKNIMADPHVTIQTSDGVEQMKARRVTDDNELRMVFETITQRNPVMMEWHLKSLDIEPTVDNFIAHKDKLYLFTFDPTDVPTPPPQEADLTWIWGTLAAIVALRWLLRPRRR